MYENFYIGDLFEVINNPQLDKKFFTFRDDADYPYFTRTENNNGILGNVEYLDDEHKIRGNSLAVGMISMNFHYMKHDFYAGQFTKTLVPKFKGFNEHVALYFISILNKYSTVYKGYLVRDFKSLVSNTKVPLPVFESLEPSHVYTVDDINWHYMQDRIKELEQDRIKELEQDRIKELEAYLIASGLDNYELNDEERILISDCDQKVLWKQYAMEEIFDLKKGKRLTKANQTEGETLFVGASSENHGETARIGQSPLFPPNTITVSYNGSVGQAFYQTEPYWASDDINVCSLKGHGINAEIGSFLCAVIRKAGQQFAYSQKWKLETMKKSKISLPTKPDNKIDFDYMERYIKAIEKLTIADVVKYKDKIIETTKVVIDPE